VAFFQFNAKLQVAFHDLLVDFLPLTMLFAFDYFIQSVQSSLFLSNINEFLSEKEEILQIDPNEKKIALHEPINLFFLSLSLYLSFSIPISLAYLLIRKL
jgi:hypothetical protein